jgi:hypothetical protein
MDAPIKNPSGLVYVRYYMPAPKYVSVGGHEYVFNVQHGVSMLCLPPEEAAQLVAVRGTGCCGQPAHPFYYPNQESINVWATGNR